ncbi:MAG TPA: 30S ribosomal protein S15 [Euryarchaeota archaeon]|nr:30S ribosomal protein S15 [Euryarchaeota archaeon]
MARMHIRRKGKSSSTRPFRTVAPNWVEMNADEIEDIIVKLAKKGESPSKIGIILRDNYGIPLARYFTKKKITKSLEDKGIKFDIPEDMMNLIKRAVKIHNHLQENKKDMISKRALQLTEAKIRRLVKYYISRGKLPEGWKYTISSAKLLVR